MWDYWVSALNNVTSTMVSDIQMALFKLWYLWRQPDFHSQPKSNVMQPDFHTRMKPKSCPEWRYYFLSINNKQSLNLLSFIILHSCLLLISATKPSRDLSKQPRSCKERCPPCSGSLYLKLTEDVDGWKVRKWKNKFRTEVRESIGGWEKVTP